MLTKARLEFDLTRFKDFNLNFPGYQTQGKNEFCTQPFTKQQKYRLLQIESICRRQFIFGKNYGIFL